MLQWDLSDTPVVKSDAHFKVPTEGELVALMVGLLMLEGITYDALCNCELVLLEEHQSQLAEIFEYRVPELAREFGPSAQLRERLAELTGIRITRCAQRIQP